MELDWIEAIGYTGTGLTILSYGAKHLVPLRMAAILSSLAFLTYGLLVQSYPLVLMEVVLLPINIFRLLELVTDRRRPAATAGPHGDLKPLPAIVGSTWRSPQRKSRPSTS